jgi:hypothetical protein
MDRVEVTEDQAGSMLPDMDSPFAGWERVLIVVVGIPQRLCEST